jgi:diacylglycerol kinase family enzyme
MDTVRVFRCSQVTISADRPFEMYADGDPVGTLPVRVSALRGAVSVITPASGCAALSAQLAPDVPAGASHAPGSEA